ncbi:TPA: hypothetical protein ACOJRH_001439 [Vibrio harveyi]|uniref:hypothetical protein n=1 Tax=Vibrio harveyi TaxID=669 RepID=UPI00390AA705
MVKEIPDDAPSSLSEMTPFDFRVIERHPQERGTSELGIFYSLSRLEAKRSSGQSPLPALEAQHSIWVKPAPGSRSAAFYMGEARSLLSLPFRRKKAAMQAA